MGGRETSESASVLGQQPGDGVARGGGFDPVPGRWPE
jgi:hypothetical protein